MHRRRTQLAALAALAAFVLVSAAAAEAPAKERILFHRASGTGVADIYSVHADGRGLRRLTTTRNTFQPVWSPDGKRIAFASDRGRGSGPLELYVMDADGRNVERLTRGLLSARGWEASYDPAWSPDGSRLVFARLTVVGKRAKEELYVVGADGRGLKQLTSTPTAREKSPTWSPDGSTIAFERNGAVWTMNADGSGARRLVPEASHPRFSPDGTRLVFSDARGRVAVVGSDGRGRRNLVRGSGPSWSAEGRRIVFQRLGGLHVVGLDGKGLRRLTRTPQLRHDLEPSWQPAPTPGA